MERPGRVAGPVSSISDDAADAGSCELLHGGDDDDQLMPILRVAWQHFHMGDELARPWGGLKAVATLTLKTNS